MSAEAAVQRLVLYYEKKKEKKEIKRVISSLGNTYDILINEASVYQAIAWTEHMYKLYKKYNLKEEVNITLIKLRKLGLKINDELKLISNSFKLPKNNIENYVNNFITGNILDVLKKFTISFLPKKDIAENELTEISKLYPLKYLFGQSLQDSKGRNIAIIGSLESDLEGHVVRQICQNMCFYSLPINLVIEKAKEKLSFKKEDILIFIQNCPIIDESRFEIIEKSLDAFFENNFLTFAHLLIPQIEEALRNFIELVGGNVLKEARNGGFQLKTFDEILREKILIDTLGDDFAIYFRILFTDQRGWNLRNNIFHGLSNPNEFNVSIGNRLLHSLLYLCMIQKK